jgi:predicted nucleic-acid-binding Zn-ribbon protein
MKKRQRKKNLTKGFCPWCNSDAGVEFLRPDGDTVEKQLKNLMKGRYKAVHCKCGYSER